MKIVSERSRRIAKKISPAVFVGVAGALLTVRLFAMVSRYSVNVLFGDQWDFLSSFFGHNPTLLTLFFWQHGPHREGIGLLADKFLYPLTAWNVRIDSFLIGGCIVAAMLLAVRLKQRLFGKIEYSDVLIPAIFLTLAQYEILAITPNPAYSGFPLLLLMLYLLALLQANEYSRYGLVLIVNFLMIYTGFGIFIGPLTIGLFALLCYRSLRGSGSLAMPAASLTLACASFGSFFAGYKFEPAVDCFVFPYHRLVDYPWFVALMFSTFAGLRSPVVLVSIVGAILLGFVMWIFAAEVKRVTRAKSFESAGFAPVVGMILAGYSLLFAANTAIGRVCLGLPAPAQSSRYTTLLIPAFLAMYFYALRVGSKKARELLFVLLALLLIPGHIHLPSSAAFYANRKTAWADCYQRSENIGACDAQTAFKIYPYPERTHLQQKLEYLKKNKLNLFAK